MYTEIELSEFITRCRLKIGEIALTISEKQRYGQNVLDLIDDSTFLRIFTNTVYAEGLEWSTHDLYKRVEHVTQRFELISRPTYSQDLMNKFAPLQPIYKTGGELIEVPKTGEGYMYFNNGVISLIPEVKHTINDLPTA